MGVWYIVNVEGAIVREDGRYLLVVRGAGETHAAGMLSLVGGKVEDAGTAADILETTLRREIREEVGIEVGDIHYVSSSAFVGDDGEAVVDIVFLCRHESGEAVIGEPEEVAELMWLTPDEVRDHPTAPIWTKAAIERAEQVRQSIGA